MKQAAGWPNSAGTRITAVALARLQSRRSGVTVTEQIRTRAVNIVRSTDHTGPRRSRYHGHTDRTVIALTPDAMGRGGGLSIFRARLGARSAKAKSWRFSRGWLAYARRSVRRWRERTRR